MTELNHTRRQMEDQNIKMLELHDSIFAYEEVVRERDNLQNVVNDQKKILERWSKASNISHDLIKDHVAFQTNCILDGKLKTAALTSEIFQNEEEIKKLDPIQFPPNYQTLAHNYSRQKDKENLLYKPMSIVETDDSPCEHAKYIPKKPSIGVSVLGPPPQSERGLSRRARKAIRKQSLQNFDSRPSCSEEGQSSKSSQFVPDVILRMEKQIEMLSRQFQSVNAKISCPPQPSGAPKNKQKQVRVSKTPTEHVENVPKAVKKLQNRQSKKVAVFVSPVEAPTPPVVEQTVPVTQNVLPPSSDPNLLVFATIVSDQVSQNPSSDGFSKMN